MAEASSDVWQKYGASPKVAELKKQLLLQFHRSAQRSPALDATIGFGLRYIQVDLKTSDLVFDVRALLMGMLIHGGVGSSLGNTAQWVRQWLSERVGPQNIERVLRTERVTDPELLLGAFSAEPRANPILSRSVSEARKDASRIAAQTVGTKSFALRHLFAALIDTHSFESELKRMFGLTLTSEDEVSLKMALIEGIMIAPEKGETREAWMAAVGLSLVFEPEPPPEMRDGVPGFARDRAVAPKDDLLGTAADATALARLICLEEATPLAVAVFGGWGSGKSTFMDRLDQEIEDLTTELADRGEAAAAGGQARFVRRVVQIRFNAWQFVDANLWASLTAEFFDQLRAGGWRKVTAAKHTGLVEKVNQHVHSLTSQAEAGRASAIEGEKALLKAQVARDKAAEAAKTAAQGKFREAALQALGDAFESQKARLRALGLESSKGEISDAIDTTVDVARDLGKAFGPLRAFFTVLWKAGRQTAFAGLGLAVAIVAAWYGLPRLLAQSWAPLVIASIPAFLVGAGAALRTLVPAVRLVGGLARRAGEIAKGVKEAEATSLKALLASEIRLREVSQEAEARREAVHRTEQALARYVDPAAGRNPPRLLRYVLEDDPDTKALEKEIGLIGRTRRLFQAVDSIVSEERSKAATDKATSEVPDRIVLYIDDLDRCTEAQVYAVLQAVHLLLSFDLFAVVVGVDVAWVQEALAKSFRDKADSRERTQDEIQKDRERASQYLEKIFQVAFWLSPLEAQSGDSGAYGRYVRALASSPATAGEAPAAARPPPPPAEAAEPATSTPEAPLADGPAEDAGSDSVALEGLDTILLDDVEVAFLASPEIAGIAASTPRGVKRLINVYRLARMRLAQGGGLPLGHGARPADYPLLALMAAIETGRTMAVADGFFLGLSDYPPSDLLNQFLKRDPMGSSPRLTIAVTSSRAMEVAVKAVLALRPQLTLGEVRAIARIVRRYSFNSFS